MDFQGFFLPALSRLRIPSIRLHFLDRLRGRLSAKANHLLVEDHRRDSDALVDVVVGIDVPDSSFHHFSLERSCRRIDNDLGILLRPL